MSRLNDNVFFRLNVYAFGIHDVRSEFTLDLLHNVINALMDSIFWSFDASLACGCSNGQRLSGFTFEAKTWKVYFIFPHMLRAERSFNPCPSNESFDLLSESFLTRPPCSTHLKLSKATS